MDNPINSTEEALAILHKKFEEFTDELMKSKDVLSEDAISLINNVKNFANLDENQRNELLGLLKDKFIEGATTKLWIYGGFGLCVIIIALLFFYIGYYKLYKPMAEKERKQLEKKQKKEHKKRK